MSDLRTQQKDALIEALKRYGYTLYFPPTHYPAVYFGSWIQSAQEKPYWLYESNEGSLVILHQNCTDCSAMSDEHALQFLKDLIPVIGRLDAHAELYEREGWGPRLLINV